MSDVEKPGRSDKPGQQDVDAPGISSGLEQPQETYPRDEDHRNSAGLADNNLESGYGNNATEKDKQSKDRRNGL